MEKHNDKSSTNENLVFRFPTPPLESDKPSDSKSSGSTSFLIENLVSEKSPSDQTRCVAVYKGKHEFSETEKDEKEDSNELSAQKDVHKNPDDFQLSAGQTLLLHKKPRTTFSTDQIRELEKRFESQKYLGTKERSELAAALGLTDTQIKTWFQNRRMKFKRHCQAASELSIEKFPSFSPAPGFSFGVPQGVPPPPMFYPPLYPGYQPLLLPYQGSDSCAAFYSRPRILSDDDHRAKASCMAFPPLENKLPWSYAPLLAPYFDVPTYAYP